MDVQGPFLPPTIEGPSDKLMTRGLRGTGVWAREGIGDQWWSAASEEGGRQARDGAAQTFPGASALAVPSLPPSPSQHLRHG